MLRLIIKILLDINESVDLVDFLKLTHIMGVFYYRTILHVVDCMCVW